MIASPLILSRRLLATRSVLFLHRSPHPHPSSYPFHCCIGTCRSLSVNGKSFKTRIKDILDNKEINTIPNLISFSRILASPLLAVTIAMDMKEAALTGCLVFGFTDWLDGYLAKKLNQKTVFGAFLDPLADKFMIGSVTIGLTLNGLIPLPLMAVIVGRDLVLLMASFGMRAMEKSPESAFFDTTNSATFVIAPSILSKVCLLVVSYCLLQLGGWID